ncbi:MAG: hypothetical protein KF770_32855, partial [Anaerolineae bacterium]|nr:hypothetical protein [Anaerolineae bacterium]
AVPAASALLNQSDHMRLRLFYTAAVLLQRLHTDELHHHVSYYQSLPDYFSAELDLDLSAPPQVQIQQLACRHRELSGVTANWAGTYHYAADRILTRLSREIAWAV